MSIRKGTEWHKWDLHIHTPSSIEQSYGGNNDDVWDRFINELEELDTNIRVIGISDYWFLDGYHRVLEAKEAGRLKNIEKIFPVVEIRIDKFGTAKSNALSRVNVHFILNPDANIEKLYNSLCGILECEHELANGQQYRSTIRPNALQELGTMLLNQSRESGQAVNDSPLQLGFANFQAQFSRLRERLNGDRYLRENTLVILGRREWEDIKWGGSATAEKYSLMNFADAVFTASPTQNSLVDCIDKLKAAGVNSKVIHASDAHEWPIAPIGPRSLGHCFTWINADMSFTGLKHALTEYENRVCFETVPASETRAANQPETIITDVAVRPTGSTHKVFDLDIPLNAGFVAIIGNKGQGKSALVDSIAHGASSGRDESYSFLRKDRFLGDPAARTHEVQLTWADKSTVVRPFIGNAVDSMPRVEYLPQQLVEQVCSADPTTVKGAYLETEIERVVFQHVPPESRGDASSFAELLNDRLASVHEGSTAARAVLSHSVRSLVQLIDERDELDAQDLHQKLNDKKQRVQEMQDELGVLTASLQAHNTASGLDHLNASRARFEELMRKGQSRLDEAKERQRRNEQLRTDGVSAINDIREMVSTINAKNAELNNLVEADIAIACASFSEVDAVKLANELDRKLSDSRGWAEAWKRFQTSLETKLSAVQEKIDEHSANPTIRAAEGLRVQINEHMSGDGVTTTSITSIQRQIERLGAVNGQITESWSAIRSSFSELLEALKGEAECKMELYSHASDRLTELTQNSDLKIEFTVDTYVSGFKDSWVEMVNRQKLGSLDDLSEDNFDEAFFSGLNLVEFDDLWPRVESLITRLSQERAATDGGYRGIGSLMRSGWKASDLLERILGLEWLVTRYRISADGRDLNQLSPGQRGLILLLFYLLLDKQNIPLLLDQPEENLDNESIRRILIPAMRIARQNRQLITVTHNANLAVVGDADQVILAKRDDAGSFTYEAGSLVDFGLSNPIVNVLEGSQDAFDNRSVKYKGMKLSGG